MSEHYTPVARGLFIAEHPVELPDTTVDLYGVVTALRAVTFPYVQKRLVVFAELSGGSGTVPTFVEVRRVLTDELVLGVKTADLVFRDRVSPIRYAHTLIDTGSPSPGIYSFDLYCDNSCVASTTVSVG